MGVFADADRANHADSVVAQAPETSRTYRLASSARAAGAAARQPTSSKKRVERPWACDCAAWVSLEISMVQRPQLTRSSGIGSGPVAAVPQPASIHTAIDAVRICQLVMIVLLVEPFQ